MLPILAKVTGATLKKSLLFSFALMGAVGAATAIPLVVLTGLGKHFDERFGTAPYILYASLAIATTQALISVLAISKKASTILEKINS